MVGSGSMFITTFYLFSTIKRVEITYLRSSMGENRLNSLTLLDVEADLTKTVRFNDAIGSFVSQKSRKKFTVISFIMYYKKKKCI